MPTERILPSVFRGHRALAVLSTLLAPAAQSLVLNMSAVRRVDAYGGSVLRAAVEMHVARDPLNDVTIVEPVDDAAWALTFDLLGGSLLPLRSRWAGSRSAGRRGSEVLVPATPIVDEEDVRLLVDETIRRAAGALGYGDHAGHFLQEAAQVFLANAQKHGEHSPVPPIVCASLEPQANDLQLVTLDLAGNVPAGDAAEVALRAAVGGGSSGSLNDLVVPRRGGLDVSVRLSWGTGRAWFRTGDSWHFDTSPGTVPGFVVGGEVHRWGASNPGTTLVQPSD